MTDEQIATLLRLCDGHRRGLADTLRLIQQHIPTLQDEAEGILAVLDSIHLFSVMATPLPNEADEQRADLFRRIATNIKFFYMTEERDIQRVIASDALPSEKLREKYAALRTKIKSPD